ncbi:MAG: PP2C family protein-serine/threonine phosphatase [Nocardiopsaceae bacterium]|nr:PP2C family protein-serine/threonine phosphatase [Nocardiopsaceae bacterium]
MRSSATDHGAGGAAPAAGDGRTGRMGRTRRLSLSTPIFVLWIVGITAAILIPSVLMGSSARLLSFLVFLPALVAGVGTLSQTAIAAAWTLLVVTATFIYRGTLDENPVPLGITAALAGLSILWARYRVRKEEEIARLRSAAIALQQRVLRPFPLTTDQVTVDGLYWAVEEDSMVGGDIYEVVASPHGTRVLIADVQGKGLSAIGVAFAVLAAFRATAHREPCLTGVADSLENAVTGHNAFSAQIGESERFVTALILNIGETPEVQVIHCGHVPPHVLHGGRAWPVIPADPGLPLGLGRLGPEPRAVERFDLPADATLLLCTDGITEARDTAGAFYPLAKRLPAWDGDSPTQIAESLGADVRMFTGNRLRDDIAVLVLRRRPPLRRNGAG